MITRFLRPLAAAIVIVTPALAQDEVPLKPVLRAGQEFAYSMGMNLEVNQRLPGGEAQKTTVICGALARMKVMEISAEGVAKLAVELEKANVEAPIGDQDAGFRWPLELPLGEESGGDKKLAPILAKARIEMTVDEKGVARVVSGFDEFVEAAKKLGYTDDRIMGFFTPEKFGAALTPAFNVDNAWTAPRAVGKGWQEQETVALPPAAALELTTNFQVTDADSDVVNYFGNMAVALKRPEEANADVAQVSMQRGAGGTKGSFDRRRNLLKHHKTSMTIVTDWKLGDVELHQEQSSFMSLRLEDEKPR